MEFERSKTPKTELSLVALIDVSLFLLIFFMVAGTIEKFEIIPIDPPVAESGKLIDEGHIVILIGLRDEIIIDDELITLEQLESSMREALQANPNKIITLKADAIVEANRMIEVMDAIRRAGGTNISLVTQKVEKHEGA